MAAYASNSRSGEVETSCHLAKMVSFRQMGDAVSKTKTKTKQTNKQTKPNKVGRICGAAPEAGFAHNSLSHFLSLTYIHTQNFILESLNQMIHLPYLEHSDNNLK